MNEENKTPRPLEPSQPDFAQNAGSPQSQDAHPVAPVQPAHVASAQPVQSGAAAQSESVAANAASEATAQIPAPQAAYDVHAQAQQAYQQQVYQQYAMHAQGQHVDARAAGKKDSAGKRFAVSFAGAALAVVIGLGGFAGYQAVTGGGSSVAPGAGATIQVDGEDTTLAQAVADKALPSIASIDVYQRVGGNDFLSALGFEAPGAGSDSTLAQASLGSGVVISSDGYIVTNNHVVEDADALKVTVDGVEYDAEVVGSDPSSDIAVIKADATGLTPIEIGSSSDLEVGEWVMALGNPFGLDNSVSTGIVSALQRSTTMQDEKTGQTVVYPNMIQTDATINPGNSGGALVDAEGKLVGINSMIQSYSGSSSGVGFAIPVDYAMGIANQIMEGKAPTHAQLGVSMVEVNPDMVQRYGLATDSGVYVANVYADSAADAAGIKKGDIITSFDGQNVTSASDLQLMVRGKNPGDTVEVKVNRDGAEQTLSVTMGSDEDALGTTENDSDAYGYGYSDPYGYGNGYGQGGNGGGLFGFGY